MGLLPGTGLYAGAALNESMMLGMRMAFTVSTSEAEGGDKVESTTIAVMPSFEYLIPTASIVRPFAGFSIGYASSKVAVGDQSFNTTGLVLGPDVGLHVFANDNVSFDPYLEFLYDHGGASMSGVDLDRRGTSFAVGLALSGWLGGHAPGKDAEEGAAPQQSVSGSGSTTEGGAESSATPAPRASASVASAAAVKDDSGALSVTLKVTLAHDVTADVVVVGRPAKDPQHAIVRMGRSSSADAPAAKCEQALIQIGDATHPFTEFRSATHTVGMVAVELVQQGTAEIAALDALGAAPGKAYIKACDDVWGLPLEERSKLSRFVEQFRLRVTK